MMTTISIFISLIAGFAIGWFARGGVPRRAGDADASSAGAPPLMERQAAEKEENLARVRALFAEKARVTNDDVERLLGVSNATAERYLNELEKTGTVRQVGTTGKSVYYEKV